MTERWPELDFAAQRPVIESLHAYLQVIGKLPTRSLPWCNHSWHLALRVVPRGFRSYPVFAQNGEAEVMVDCHRSTVWVETSAGFAESFAITGQSVADFHEQLTQILRRAGVETDISGAPNEVEDAVPFPTPTGSSSNSGLALSENPAPATYSGEASIWQSLAFPGGKRPCIQAGFPIFPTT